MTLTLFRILLNAIKSGVVAAILCAAFNIHDAIAAEDHDADCRRGYSNYAPALRFKGVLDSSSYKNNSPNVSHFILAEFDINNETKEEMLLEGDFIDGKFILESPSISILLANNWGWEALPNSPGDFIEPSVKKTIYPGEKAEIFLEVPNEDFARGREVTVSFLEENRSMCIVSLPFVAPPIPK